MSTLSLLGSASTPIDAAKEATKNVKTMIEKMGESELPKTFLKDVECLERELIAFGKSVVKKAKKTTASQQLEYLIYPLISVKLVPIAQVPIWLILIRIRKL